MASLARKLSDFMNADGQVLRVVEAARGKGPILVRGVGAGRCALVAHLAVEAGATLLVVTYSPERGRALLDDVRDLLAGEDVLTLFYPDVAGALYDGVLPAAEDVAQRIRTLDALAANKRAVVVAPVQAAMHLTAPKEVWAAARLVLSRGQQIDRDELADMLGALGYQRVQLVEAPGQMAVRGGIVDFFSAAVGAPVRVEFFGDEVEALRYFEVETQRSTGDIDHVDVPPAGEVLLTREWVDRALPSIRTAFRRELDRLYEEGKKHEADRLREEMHRDLEALEALRPTPELLHYLPYLYPELNTIFDYLPEDAIVVVDEPGRVQQAAVQFHEDIARSLRAAAKLGTRLRLPQNACLPWEALVGKYLRRPRWRKRTIYLSMIRPDVAWEPGLEHIEVKMPPPESYGGKMELLVRGIREHIAGGGTVIVCTRQVDDTLQALSARGLTGARKLSDNGVAPGGAYVAEAELSAGFQLPAARLLLLTSREIFGWQKIRRGEERAYRPGFSLTSLRELQEGDYVVHIHHGIGIYRGIVRETIDGIDREYLLIEYAEGDRLYVPVTQLDRVQKYIGVEGKRPTIHRLQSRRWQQQKRQARRSALRLAHDLLVLYRAREQARKQPLAADSPWLHELEASFQYEETPDQLRAIEDIKADLARPRPADRLICGDVGFGKTEVAIRAAFIVVLAGRQVAVLVPTTVLAEQHYHTFTERLAPYPVRVEMLSRFKTKAEQRRIVEGLKTGEVDIVIGTHRLLMSDVQFKDLGLLIIDEEQRFGVEQKEKLKKLRHNVDVITLTATPIPRTLNMALSGIRDITVINDPPRGRLPVRTYVRERDEDLIREAIRRELARGGQVYFVHNRVHSIPHIAAQVQRLVPEARVAVAHGQMPEEDLERVMMAFYGHEIDVLVCTTIVESGLDVPNANTIIIDDADRLGLAQLYQLRGRVGRADRQAYAYLLYRYPEHLTPEAEQRLRAIEEFAELGAGLKVAMRDLEIRGAGNLLGAEQSGHLAAVGLDLFCEMLADSVRALRGEVQYLGDRHASIDLPVQAIIGHDYIPAENLRIAAYRRLGAAESEEEVEAIARELEDRFGRMPQAVRNLVRLAKLRIKCWRAGVTEIRWREPKVCILLDDKAKLSQRECRVLVALFRAPTTTRRMTAAREQGHLAQFTATEHQITFAVDRKNADGLLDAVEHVLDRLVDRAEEKQRLSRGVAAQTRA